MLLVQGHRPGNVELAREQELGRDGRRDRLPVRVAAAGAVDQVDELFDRLWGRKKKAKNN